MKKFNGNNDIQFYVRNNNSRLKFIPYIGNKRGFSHIFDVLIPNHFAGLKIYDIFGGSGAFTFYASHRFGSKNVIYNDNNPIVVNLLRSLKNNPNGLYEQYEIHRKKSSKEYYYEVRELDLNDGLVGAGRFFYLAKNAFSGKIRFNPSGKFNCPPRKGSKCPNVNKNDLIYISYIIRDLEIKNESFEFFSHLTDSFIYLDPPYLNNPNGHYNQLVDPDQFINFVKKLNKFNQIMISEQNSPDLLKLSSNFHIYPILLKRSLQYNTKKDSNEIIAINYECNIIH